MCNGRSRPQSLNVPFIAISDSSLSPLAKTAEILFAIPKAARYGKAVFRQGC